MAVVFVDTCPGKLDPGTRAAWAKIDAYPLDHVRQHLVRNGMEESAADESVAELRKFFQLIALGHERLAMASEAVDEAWHTFILFTLDYSRFCEHVFGRFIHHNPFIPGEARDPRGASVRFRQAYTQAFGEPPATWRQPARCDPDCEGCSGTIDRPAAVQSTSTS